MIDFNKLVKTLREMDAQQQVTDEEGGRELAWYYWRDGIEDILELPRGTLDTYGESQAIVDAARGDAT